MKTGGKNIIIIGGTNQFDQKDPALRKAEIFEREIWLNIKAENNKEKNLAR